MVEFETISKIGDIVFDIITRFDLEKMCGNITVSADKYISKSDLLKSVKNEIAEINEHKPAVEFKCGEYSFDGNSNSIMMQFTVVEVI